MGEWVRGGGFTWGREGQCYTEEEGGRRNYTKKTWVKRVFWVDLWQLDVNCSHLRGGNSNGENASIRACCGLVCRAYS